MCIALSSLLRSIDVFGLCQSVEICCSNYLYLASRVGFIKVSSNYLLWFISAYWNFIFSSIKQWNCPNKYPLKYLMLANIPPYVFCILYGYWSLAAGTVYKFLFSFYVNVLIITLMAPYGGLLVCWFLREGNSERNWQKVIK